MRPTHVLGIDPGESGGYCLINIATLKIVAKGKTSKDNSDLLVNFLVNQDIDTTKVYIELVNGIPNNPKTGQKQSANTNFNFGFNVGKLHGYLEVMSFNFQTVSPIKWQREVGIYHIKGESKTDKKNRHKQIATKIFDIPFTHWQADATLIAYYGCLVERAK